VVGLALGTSGVALQGIFRNPLVDSGLIGIASGASLFASAYIMLNSLLPILIIGSVQITMATVAFIGAALTAFLVYRISLFQSKINITVLILAGVALNALSGSLTGLLTYFADDKQLRDLTFWTLGSLSGASWSTFWILFPFVSIPFIILLKTTKSLNAFALGENPAHFLGVNIKRTKIIVLLCSTAMVGACVAFSGVIGFVGLVIPHILRLIIGPNHKSLMPLSALAGGCLVCLADLTSRTLLPPTEIPIGIITSLIGTPVLLIIILKQKRSLFA
jgi:iron complex transport system permease protein